MSVGENSPGARLAVVLYTTRASTTITHPPKRGDWTLPRPVLPLTARTPPKCTRILKGVAWLGIKPRNQASSILTFYAFNCRFWNDSPYSRKYEGAAAEPVSRRAGRLRWHPYPVWERGCMGVWAVHLASASCTCPLKQDSHCKAALGLRI